MRSSTLFCATFVAAVIAAPHLQHQHKHRDLLAERALVWDIEIVTKTVYVTEGSLSKSTRKPAPKVIKTTSSPPPAVPTTTATPTPSVAPVIAAEPVTPPSSSSIVVVTYSPPASSSTAAAQPAQTPSAPAGSNDGSPMSDGVSVLTTCNKYRALYNLQPFAWSAQLTGNAAKTGDMNGGVNQNHHLFDGSMGQVITPGLDSDVPGVTLGGLTPFEMAFLSWMCESSGDSQISNLCPIMQSAMNMQYSSKGHYDILTSTSYTSIGCAFTKDPNAASNSPYQGTWTCDVS